MLISEIFYTLQGEGTYTGVPCLFIRTAGCNLRCGWCDTPYTSWHSEGDRRDIDELLAETARWSDVRHAVISGGEPLIQTDLGELVDKLKGRGHFVTIETAGTLHCPDVQPQFFSVSPKLRHSVPAAEHARERALHERNNTFEHLPRFMEGDADYQFKFVVEGDGDTSEVNELVERFDIPRHKVFLMPQGMTPEDLNRRGPVVAEICKREGFNFTARLQIELWGNTRGT